MVYSYTPTYYSSSFHETLTSLCKSILNVPFSLKNRRFLSDQKLDERQTDNLKWQQESFHKILNLIGLQKEGMVLETEVSGFRSHLLDTLIASPKYPEPAALVRDKLLFLQELFYAKCISADQYHSSKRPLLQRLAAEGVEIDRRDLSTNFEEEEWSVIELSEKEPPPPVTKTQVKSLFSWKGQGKMDQSSSTRNNCSILMPESSEKAAKRKPFRALFDKEQREDDEANYHNKSIFDLKEKMPKSLKKQWGFDGLKTWKKSGTRGEDEPNLIYRERSDDASSRSCTLVASPIGDKVLGENIKKELSRIKSELNANNRNLNLSDDQMEAISTRLPAEKSDLNKFFPRSWCDKYGDKVLDVVRKEFDLRNTAAKEKNDENYNPNLFF